MLKTMNSELCRLCLRLCPNTRSAFDDEQILKDVFPFWKDFEWCIPVLACPECKTTIGTFHSFSVRVHSNILWQTSQIELFTVQDEVSGAVKTETPELFAEDSGEPATSISKENIYEEIEVEKQELPELPDGDNHEPNINSCAENIDEEIDVQKNWLPELSDDENEEPFAGFSDSDIEQNDMMETKTENQGSPGTVEEECMEQDIRESTSNSATDRTTNSTNNSMFLKKCWIVLDKIPARVVSSISPARRKIKRFICHVCNKVFNSSNALYTHKIRNHTANDKLIHQCKYCSEKFAREYMLAEHLFTHRVKKCRFCNESYGGAVSYKQHIIEKHDGGKFKCSFCSCRFKRKRALAHHLLFHDENTPKKICKICCKEYDYRSGFRYHMNHVHGGDKYECAHCGIKVTAKRNLERHLLRKHVTH
ncbi:zinc finger and BTB domain-containing protein 41-like [Anopheles bellator]|uniref:zinc finger and BTB domain-containing protein 41-like n=1 Tax=Anopheles bellator TaxID=139047 RepID=UPI0026493FF0|nr:zinc finger and BTB domain-containing protein 41-like [Anopheles bellator]